MGEIYGTFIFVSIILIITDEKTTYISTFKNSVIVFATITLLGLSSGRNFTASGGGLNPAIAIGLEFWISVGKNDFGVMTNFYIYVLGPLVGSFLSINYFKFVHVYALDWTAQPTNIRKLYRNITITTSEQM